MNIGDISWRKAGGMVVGGVMAKAAAWRKKNNGGGATGGVISVSLNNIEISVSEISSLVASSKGWRHTSGSSSVIIGGGGRK
jgi:hypothetical protein